MKKDLSKLPAQLKKLQFSPDGALALPASRPKPDSESASAHAEAAARGALFIEKRREARYPTSDPVQVELTKGGTAPLGGTIMDVSRSGLCIRLETAVQRGAEVKITLQRDIVIYGQVRHCRRAESGFDAGVIIQDMSRNAPSSSTHIDDDLLSLYVIGKGLTVPEVIKLKEHLVNCESCRIRLGEKDAVINPVRRRKILVTPPATPRDPADD